MMIEFGMNELSEKPIQATYAESGKPATFQSIFFPGDNAVSVRVPDYQRAYTWEQKQLELFLADLVKYQCDANRYYFGHFIAEDIGKDWEIVDGQQRITTFVLFLMVCRVLSPIDTPLLAFSMIHRFSTVSYDLEALQTIAHNLGAFLEMNGYFDERRPPTDEQIKAGLSLTGTFTRSQRRMVMALLRFHQAFQEKDKKKVRLERDKIGDYINAVMTAHCSHHLTQDKSVAVNIFEMHNTRGIPLTTLEIMKAMLMKFVYDHGGEDRESKVKQIQDEFGEIYGMEEQLAESSFRGKMTIEQLLRLHLRVVDDGNKKTAQEFNSPGTNANAETLIAYVDLRLHFCDNDKSQPRNPDEGVLYAINLAKEFKKSVCIVSETLAAWDSKDPLVGDVLILERDLSCQFFLIICRRLESDVDKADGCIGNIPLLLWERLLFTRDFHGEYYNLKGDRDNFPALFASCVSDEENITNVIKKYLVDGFRWWDVTKGLQPIVVSFLKDNKSNILNNAFYWWKQKMIYAIYKYEACNGAKIREVMKGTISVEHILPQEWQWEWIDGWQDGSERSPEEKEAKSKEIGTYINGLGNLLLLTPGENTAASNKHPAKKEYERYCVGVSYEDYHRNQERWLSSKEWSDMIGKRGEEIYRFMLSTLVAAPEEVSAITQSAPPDNHLLGFKVHHLRM